MDDSRRAARMESQHERSYGRGNDQVEEEYRIQAPDRDAHRPGLPGWNPRLILPPLSAHLIVHKRV